MVPGDVLVTSIRPIGTDEGVDEALAAVPGVTMVSPIATFDLAVGGAAVDAAAVDGSHLASDGRLRFVAGDRAAALAAIDDGAAAILPKALADRLGLAVGGTLEVTDANGASEPLTVAGIVERTLPGRNGEAVLVGWPEATEHLGVAGADAFAVRLDPSASAAARASTLAALNATAEEAAVDVVALDHVTGAIDDALTRVFGLFDALALVAVVVAALGIANTVTMNVMERVREIGILRATGMTRRQVWRSVVVEAGVRRRRGRAARGRRRCRARARAVGGGGRPGRCRRRRPVADDRLRPRPGDRAGDARGGLPGPAGGPDLDPGGRRVRVSGC